MFLSNSVIYSDFYQVMWGGLPTQLLQAAGGLPFMAPIIEAAISNIMTTELDAAAHMRDIISTLKREKKPRPTLFEHNNLLEEELFQEDVERVVKECNIHKHTATCVKPGCDACRMSCPRPMVEETCCKQIVSVVKSEDHPKRYEVLSEIELPSVGTQWNRDLEQYPLAERDDRTLVWEPKRKLITTPLSTSEQNGKVKIVDFLDLPEDLQSVYDQFSESTQKQIIRAIVERNGSVVEYNEVASVLLGCNTDASMLGSDSQAKLALCYILIYMTKPPAQLTKTISLVLHAREQVEQYPSKAEDTGSETRTAMYFLNKVLNDLSGLIEISAQMALACLLGMPGETCTHEFQLLFVDAALRYTQEVKKELNLGICHNSKYKKY